NITLTSTGSLATLILTHDANGTLTLDHISAQSLTLSASGNGLVKTSNGPLVVSNTSITTLAIPSGTEFGGIVGQVFENSTFSDITINGFTVSGADSLGGIVGLKEFDISGNAKTLTFTNIHLTNILFGHGSSNYIGGLAGRMRDANISVTDCSVAGTVRGSSGIGGLIGEAHRLFATTAFTSISKSSFNGANQGAYSSGGLIGYPSGITLTISESFSKGSILAWTGPAGGLVGQSNVLAGSLIIASYSQSTVNNSNSSGNVGGLVGAIATGQLAIQQSYFSGSVTAVVGSNKEGCIAGINSATLTLMNTYFDSTKCAANAVNTGTYAGATGLATATFQTDTPFGPSWSALVWLFTLGQDPKLLWEP
nr:hypothetical protein [Pseudobdellovibrionaceae bacterium]